MENEKEVEQNIANPVMPTKETIMIIDQTIFEAEQIEIRLSDLITGLKELKENLTK